MHRSTDQVTDEHCKALQDASTAILNLLLDV